MTYYNVTFCFSLYDADRSFTWKNWFTNKWDGPYIHCEVYDRHEQRGYLITFGTKTVVKERRFYGDTGWEFITVALDYTEYSRMIEYFAEKIALRPTIKSSNIYLFPLQSCCNCNDDNTMTCGELIIGMMARVWQKKLKYPAHVYAPSDVHATILELIENRTARKSSIQGNPSPLVHNIGGLVEQ